MTATEIGLENPLDILNRSLRTKYKRICALKLQFRGVDVSKKNKKLIEKLEESWLELHAEQAFIMNVENSNNGINSHEKDL